MMFMSTRFAETARRRMRRGYGVISEGTPYADAQARSSARWTVSCDARVAPHGPRRHGRRPPCAATPQAEEGDRRGRFVGQQHGNALIEQGRCRGQVVTEQVQQGPDRRRESSYLDRRVRPGGRRVEQGGHRRDFPHQRRVCGGHQLSHRLHGALPQARSPSTTRWASGRAARGPSTSSTASARSRSACTARASRPNWTASSRACARAGGLGVRLLVAYDH